ncbi:MAG: WD40 repeat domain-containing protein [Candidatus Hydrothermarchaeales archaeon]
MRLPLLLLCLMAVAACVQAPEEAAPTSLTLAPELPAQTIIPTESPFPTISAELPWATPTSTPAATPAPTPPSTPAPTPQQTQAPVKADYTPLKLLWSYETGKDVYGAAVSTNGDIVVAGSWDHHVHVLDKSGELLWKFKARGSVNDVDITPSGDRIVATSYVIPNGTVYLFDKSGKLLWKKETESLSKGIAISPTGDSIVFGLDNDKIIRMDKKGAILWEHETRHSAWGVWDVALTSDGRLVAGSDDAYTYFFDAAGELSWEDTRGSRSLVLGVDVSPNGDYVAVAAHDNDVYLYKGNSLLWKYETGRLNYGVALSSDASYVAVGSWDKNLYLLNRDGKLVVKYPIGSYVNRVVFSPDDKYLAVAASDGSLYFFEIA